MPEKDAALGADPHLRCRHKHYRLTCAAFDELMAEADGCCQVCRLPGEHNSKRMLFIDHDGGRGNWAVRGLLCNTCNTVLGKDLEMPRNAAFAAYLQNAWYLRMLAALGVGPGLPAEPPIGSVVDFGGRPHPRRMRVSKGWIREVYGYPWGAVTWWSLYRTYGPHRLNVIRLGDGKPLKQKRRYAR